MALVVKNPPASLCRRCKRNRLDPWIGKIPGGGHGSILAWRIPWAGEPGRLQPIASQRVWHDWSGIACMHASPLLKLYREWDNLQTEQLRWDKVKGFKLLILDCPGGTVIRIRLPMQGTQIRSLVQEDSTSYGATKPKHQNYWASAWQLLKFVHLEPTLHNWGGHPNEKPVHRKERPRSPLLEKAHHTSEDLGQPNREIS